MNYHKQPMRLTARLQAFLFHASRFATHLILIAILSCLSWNACSTRSLPYEHLFCGQLLTEQELARIEMAFGNAGLSDYQRSGLRILVPKNNQASYFKAILAANAMPTSWSTVLKQPTWTSWRSLSEVGLWRECVREVALEDALARNVARLPSIEFAKVEFDEQQTSSNSVNRSAIVHVLVPGREQVMEKVAEMTASHFAGLPLENVTVKDLGRTGL